MSGWRAGTLLALFVVLASACGVPEDQQPAQQGDATATFIAARASLLDERSARATQTAESRPTNTPVPPTATPSPTPVPTATPLPTMTPLPTPSPTPQTEPVIVFSEDFSNVDAVPYWTGSADTLIAYAADGGYAVTTSTTGSRLLELRGLAELGDASIEVDLSFEGQGSAGLFARFGDWTGGWGDRGYFCALRDTGTVWCNHVIDGQPICLCSLDAHFYAFEGTNTLRLSTVGNTIQIALNGVVIETVTDSASTFGVWGLYVSSRTGEPFHAWFDNVVVTSLPPGHILD